MASRINIITKAAADNIAATYLANKNVHFLYVTRDGQVFYKGKESYMRMHEKQYNLEKSWPYSGMPSSQIEKTKVENEKPMDNKKNESDLSGSSFTALKKYFQELTNKGEMKEYEWSSLKFAQLQKKYEEIKNKELKK